jgi:hypothetical protein
VTCERIDLGGGAVAIVCHRGKRYPRCSVPGCGRVAPFLCDFPIPRKKSGTCDAKLCEGHRVQQPTATPTEDSRDFCPPHAKLGQGSLGL